MTDTDKAENGVFADVSRNLGAFFRHLLPGVYILGAAYVAHPSWFAGVDAKSWQHLAIVGAAALASGNIWFSLNRYGVHQLIDYVAYLARSQGPARSESWDQYLDDLGTYAAKALRTTAIPERARQHVAFRASSVLLIYTVAEVGGLFALWHEPNTFFANHSTAITVVSLLAFAVGVWQNIITRRIDHFVVEGREAAQQADAADRPSAGP